jgi:hypothetical protein
MESKIKFFSIEEEKTVLVNLRSRLEKSCIDYNKTSKNFNFEYDIKDGYIFCLLTCEIESKSFPTMWRGLTVSAYESWDNIYYDGNVGMLTLDDIKIRTVNSLKHKLNKIEKALNF